MRRALFLAAILLALPLTAGSARADWSIEFGLGARGVHVQGRVGSPHRCPHCRGHCVLVPVYREVWVPPVYGRAIVGWSPCGPIVRTVVVQPGYVRKVFVGYRCGRLGLPCR